MAQRILLIRTDRIGDIVLTTPVISTLRRTYPNAHITFMCSANTQSLLEGNPNLNEVIVYNKKMTFLNQWRFATALREKKFDISFVFNPNFSCHLISYLANIPTRVGYKKRGHYLLTHAIEEKKHEGKKSEAYYNEDLLAAIGIDHQSSNDLFVPVSPTSPQEIASPYAVINVSSGCPSKTWPTQNFRQLSQLLTSKLSLDVALIGNSDICKVVKSQGNHNIYSFGERLPLPQLASLLKNAVLHITGDTGPMHMAAAVDTPIIALFGRTLPGLGPTRWGPLKGKNTILHNDIGCNPCLSHNCKIDFDCLKSIKIEDVFNETRKIVENSLR